MTYLYKVLAKMDIMQFMKRKNVSDSRSVENISDKIFENCVSTSTD